MTPLLPLFCSSFLLLFLLVSRGLCSALETLVLSGPVGMVVHSSRGIFRHPCFFLAMFLDYLSAVLKHCDEDARRQRALPNLTHLTRLIMDFDIHALKETIPLP